MRIRGPLVTLGAVVALGTGLWLGNVSQTRTQTSAPTPAAQTVATPVATAPTVATPPPAPAFPARAHYVGTVPTKAAAIALEISVDGNTATAYACDNAGIETWLRGSAVNGAVSLTSQDKASRLEGRLQGTAVVGTLRIGDKSWTFEAVPGPGGSDV